MHKQRSYVKANTVEKTILIQRNENVEGMKYVANALGFDFENNEYKKRLKDQTIDFKKFSKLQKLTNLHIEYSPDEFIKYNIKNFNEIISRKSFLLRNSF